MKQSIQITSGQFKARRLAFESQEQLRPTCHKVRQGVFNVLIHRYLGSWNQPLPLENLHIADIFSGLGGYGLEALSLGACQLTVVESHIQTLKIFRGFCEHLKCLSQVNVIEGSWPEKKALKKLSQTLEKKGVQENIFDIIFLDPPYDFSSLQIEDAVQACLPFLKDGGLLVLEHPKALPPYFSSPLGKSHSETAPKENEESAQPIESEKHDTSPLSPPEIALEKTILSRDLIKNWGRKKVGFYQKTFSPKEENEAV